MPVTLRVVPPESKRVLLLALRRARCHRRLGMAPFRSVVLARVLTFLGKTSEEVSR